MKTEKGGFLYIIRKERGKYKISITIDIKKRMSQANTNNEFNEDIVQVYYSEDYLKIEKCIKLCLEEV